VNKLAAIISVSLLLCATRLVAGEASIVSGDQSVAAVADREASSIKIYSYRNKHGVRSFSDRAPTGVRYEVVRYSCFACDVHSTVDWQTIPLQLDAYEYAINSAASRYRVDPALVRAVIHAESAFRPAARSSQGALGLMQLMPDTARDMGVSNALSPEQNIQGGVKYLAWLLEKTRGNETLATAAYNAGPGAVERYNGIPPYEETRTYVKRVKILRERYRKAMGVSSADAS
jgi:soluble lytic murein transglycosylase-like protein